MGPPASQRIPRVRWYSGYCLRLLSFAYRILTFSDSVSQPIRLPFILDYAVLTPNVFLPSVWPLPLSLATTNGISFDFSSSRYLDVSVPGVPLAYLLIQYTIHDSSPCAFPHSEIRAYAYLQPCAAYRSLSRPSSAPNAKAFTLCSSLLELSYLGSLFSLNCCAISSYSYFSFLAAAKSYFFLP